MRVFPGETVVWRFEVTGTVTELDIGFQVAACRYRDGVRGPQKPVAWTGLDRTVPLLPPSDPKQQCRYGRDGLSVNGYWTCTPSTVAAAGGGAGGGAGAGEATVLGLPTIKEGGGPAAAAAAIGGGRRRTGATGRTGPRW